MTDEIDESFASVQSDAQEAGNLEGGDWMSWRQMFEELQAFHLEYGHCCVSEVGSQQEDSSRDNLLALSAWVKEQRQQFRRGKLSENQRQELDALGFTWDGTRDATHSLTRKVGKEFAPKTSSKGKELMDAPIMKRPVTITRTLPQPVFHPLVDEAMSDDLLQTETGASSVSESRLRDRPTRKSKLAANDLMYALSLQSKESYTFENKRHHSSYSGKKSSMTKLLLDGGYRGRLSGAAAGARGAGGSGAGKASGGAGASGASSASCTFRERASYVALPSKPPSVSRKSKTSLGSCKAGAGAIGGAASQAGGGGAGARICRDKDAAVVGKDWGRDADGEEEHGKNKASGALAVGQEGGDGVGRLGWNGVGGGGGGKSRDGEGGAGSKRKEAIGTKNVRKEARDMDGGGHVNAGSITLTKPTKPRSEARPRSPRRVKNAHTSEWAQTVFMDQLPHLRIKPLGFALPPSASESLPPPQPQATTSAVVVQSCLLDAHANVASAAARTSSEDICLARDSDVPVPPGAAGAAAHSAPPHAHRSDEGSHGSAWAEADVNPVEALAQAAAGLAAAVEVSRDGGVIATCLGGGGQSTADIAAEISGTISGDGGAGEAGAVQGARAVGCEESGVQAFGDGTVPAEAVMPGIEGTRRDGGEAHNEVARMAHLDQESSRDVIDVAAVRKRRRLKTRMQKEAIVARTLRFALSPFPSEVNPLFSRKGGRADSSEGGGASLIRFTLCPLDISYSFHSRGVPLTNAADTEEANDVPMSISQERTVEPEEANASVVVADKIDNQRGSVRLESSAEGIDQARLEVKEVKEIAGEVADAGMVVDIEGETEAATEARENQEKPVIEQDQPVNQELESASQKPRDDCDSGCPRESSQANSGMQECDMEEDGTSSAKTTEDPSCATNAMNEQSKVIQIAEQVGTGAQENGGRGVQSKETQELQDNNGDQTQGDARDYEAKESDTVGAALAPACSVTQPAAHCQQVLQLNEEGGSAEQGCSARGRQEDTDPARQCRAQNALGVHDDGAGERQLEVQHEEGANGVSNGEQAEGDDGGEGGSRAEDDVTGGKDRYGKRPGTINVDGPESIASLFLNIGRLAKADLVAPPDTRVWQIKKHIVVKLAPHLSPSNLVILCRGIPMRDDAKLHVIKSLVWPQKSAFDLVLRFAYRRR